MRVRASYDKPRQSGPSVSVCALRARALTPSVSVRLRPPPSHVRLRPSVHHCTPARTLRPFPVSISGGAALLAMKVAHRCCCPLRAASTPIQSDRRAAVRRHFAPAAPARRRRCAARAISVLSVLESRAASMSPPSLSPLCNLPTSSPSPCDLVPTGTLPLAFFSMRRTRRLAHPDRLFCARIFAPTCRTYSPRKRGCPAYSAGVVRYGDHAPRHPCRATSSVSPRSTDTCTVSVSPCFGIV